MPRQHRGCNRPRGRPAGSSSSTSVSKYADEERQIGVVLEQAQERVNALLPPLIKHLCNKQPAGQSIYQRACHRWSRKHGSLTNRAAVGGNLSDIQSAALKQYIIDRDRMELPISKRLLTEVGEHIVKRSLLPDEVFRPFGDRWAKRWLEKHSIKLKKTKPIEIARKEAHDPIRIRDWFDELNRVIAEHDIKSINTWNFDESGFRIGIGGAEYILTMDPKRRC
ncbi:uncharacterized protein CLAFUR5_05062 [Fulvia fulva]|uniref:HTH CENPB-type domain-containing protein n=1 Tax=Passalora fulva TaxID=5499 RepID=A0A9Q8P7E9_PASFU|nr:uncharacterized protein CLAFUR5_05062 [Fulvia fulva]UJO15827.1 hypothetical protein CLAFUR5_05062 [Fulvia fulva]